MAGEVGCGRLSISAMRFNISFVVRSALPSKIVGFSSTKRMSSGTCEIVSGRNKALRGVIDVPHRCCHLTRLENEQLLRLGR
jgi:hypothetical protein